MGYERKNRNVMAKTISYYWLKNYNVSENDELLAPKTKVVSENSKILLKNRKVSAKMTSSWLKIARY